MFEGFETSEIDGVHTLVGGDGPPLLLLHGYPQTHVMWQHAAPVLARSHTVVLTDLRGYGDSHRPADQGDDHRTYSKRAMADEQAAVMAALGFDRFAVAGHDRGARVVHRMCLDHGGRVERAAMLDIAPTRHVFETADTQLGMAYYHWFFLAQQADLPERLIGSHAEHWIRHHLLAWSRVPDAFSEQALAEYVRCFDPAAIHASCEDYRAGAGIDLQHDRADADRRIECPLLVGYGARGFVGAKYDVDAVWRAYATDVRTVALDGGHFVAEEAPDATTAVLLDFFRPG